MKSLRDIAKLQFSAPPPKAGAGKNVVATQAPVNPAAARIDPKHSIGERDKRHERAKGRKTQFNLKVGASYPATYDELLAEEAKRTGETLTRGHFLEKLIALWQKDKGKSVTPFGLSPASWASLKFLAEDHGEDDYSGLIEDALLARVKARQAEPKKKK